MPSTISLGLSSRADIFLNRLRVTAITRDAGTPLPEKRGERKIRAWVWPGPFAFRETPDEKKEYRDFPYTEEGLDEAVGWLDEQCRDAEELRLW